VTAISMPPLSANGQAAQLYASLGWAVFPCTGKRPLTRHGLRDATRDASEVCAFWAKHEDANVGVVTGAVSAIVGLDIDPKNGGDDSLARLEKENAPLPPTRTVRTGSGGRHLYFKHPGVAVPNSAGKLGRGLDVRGDGGYLIAPPSLHPDGGTYEWLDERDPVDAPAWLLALVVAPKQEPAAAVPKERADFGADGGSRYGLVALEEESLAVAATPEGSRNDALNRAAFRIGRLVAGGELDQMFAARRLVESGMAAGLPYEEALKTVKSGLVQGMRRPRSAPPRRRSRSKGRTETPAPVPPGDYLLIPGQHIDSGLVVHEVGTNAFVAAVLARIPKGALYRRDFVVGELVGEKGSLRFAPVAEHRLRVIVDRHAKLAKWTKTMEGDIVRVFVACSRDHAGLVLAAAGASEAIPELRLLVHHPVYVAGFVLAAPGWNEESGVYYDEPEALAGLTPRAEDAALVLRDLVIDFCIKDEASRQNVFGAMVTIVVRAAIAGKVPFTLVMAPLERSGKGKLADTAIGEAVLGHAIAPMQAGRTEEEREKRITSLLIQGETVVHLDNLPIGEVLDSPALASLATSWPLWRGRLLGVSRVPLLANNLIVLLSGNNPKTTGEIAKRVVPIALQPMDAHPENRKDFLHPDAEGYARSRRRAVLEAILGIVEAWKAAGRPPAPHARTMGGFERWAEVVGGILAHAGLVEWMANYRAWVHVADEWIGDAENLIETWARLHGVRPVQAKDVLAMIRELGIFQSVTAKATEEAQWSALGKRVLVPLVGRPVGAWQVEQEGKGGSKRYRLRALVPAGHVAAGGGAPAEPGSEGSERSEGFEAGLTCSARTRARVLWDRAGNPSDPSDLSGGIDLRQFEDDADDTISLTASGALGEM
jgi:hypothetical protein